MHEWNLQREINSSLSNIRIDDHWRASVANRSSRLNVGPISRKIEWKKSVFSSTRNIKEGSIDRVGTTAQKRAGGRRGPHSQSMRAMLAGATIGRLAGFGSVLLFTVGLALLQTRALGQTTPNLMHASKIDEVEFAHQGTKHPLRLRFLPDEHKRYGALRKNLLNNPELMVNTDKYPISAGMYETEHEDDRVESVQGGANGVNGFGKSEDRKSERDALVVKCAEQMRREGYCGPLEGFLRVPSNVQDGGREGDREIEEGLVRELLLHEVAYGARDMEKTIKSHNVFQIHTDER